MCADRMAMASSTIRLMRWRTVVRSWLGQADAGMSSKPMIDTSSGTRSPSSRRAASIAPSAVMSLAQKRASGRSSRDSKRIAA